MNDSFIDSVAKKMAEITEIPGEGIKITSEELISLYDSRTIILASFTER